MCFKEVLVVTVEKAEMQRKIREVEDLIHAPKCQNSLTRFLAKTENPLENGTIARLLLLTEAEVQEIYEQSVAILRKEMNPED